MDLLEKLDKAKANKVADIEPVIESEVIEENPVENVEISENNKQLEDEEIFEGNVDNEVIGQPTSRFQVLLKMLGKTFKDKPNRINFRTRRENQIEFFQGNPQNIIGYIVYPNMISLKQKVLANIISGDKTLALKLNKEISNKNGYKF